MDEIFDKNVKIVFDTSFWIDIYRNLPTTIDTIINALKNDNFYDRILIPSFVVKEFEKNKHKGMSEHNQINKNVNEALSEAIKKGKKFISNAIESQKKRYKIENYVVENSINEHLKNIEEQGKIFLSNINNDKLSNSYLEVEKFFNDIRQKNYIDELSKDEILELFISGEDRYKKKIPPGFMDKVKEDKGGFIYGDLIIWREIIAYAKNNRTDILFVTNDTKKDWFDNDQFDKRLVKEFNDETHQKITGISAKTFYEHTSIHKGTDIISFINNVTDELHTKIYEELYFEDNKIINSYETLSHYSGDYYNLEELEYSESNYTIHFYNNIAEIKISIPISVIIKTASYSGRDEDTHEVFLYPYFTHKISGVVSYTIQKEIQELFYNNIDYSIINKDSRCEEISCEIDLDEDY